MQKQKINKQTAKKTAILGEISSFIINKNNSGEISRKIALGEDKNYQAINNGDNLPDYQDDKLSLSEILDAVDYARENDIGEELVEEWLNSINQYNQRIKKQYNNKWENNSEKIKKICKKTISQKPDIYKIAYSVKEKTEFAKKETEKKLLTNPWAAQLVAVCMVAVIFSISIGRLAPNTADDFIACFDGVILTPFEKISSMAHGQNMENFNSQEKNNIAREINKNFLAEYIKNNQDSLSTAFSQSSLIKIKSEEIFGKVAGAMEAADSVLTGNKAGELRETAEELKNLTAKSMEKEEQLSKFIKRLIYESR